MFRSTTSSDTGDYQPRTRRWPRQLAVCGCLAASILGGCDSERPAIGFEAVEGFFGGVASDEPHSVLAAREILASGGSAADAMVALLFTAAVTYPSAASLGAGGTCVVFDKFERVAEALAFPALPGTRGKSPVDRPSAVPASIRGMFALHARYGRVPWRQLVGGAERLARLGFPVSRALARDLELVGDALFDDPGMKRVFARPDGSPKREGDQLIQWDLAITLSQIRGKGPGEFYTGGLAKTLISAVRDVGGTLDEDDLRDYRPMWRETASIPLPDEARKIHTVPGPSAAPGQSSGGLTTLSMWSMLIAGDRYEDANGDERPHLLAEASMRASLMRTGYAETNSGEVSEKTASFDREAAVKKMKSYQSQGHVPTADLAPDAEEHRENPSGMGVAVVDGDGSSVACNVTLNNLFGIGRIAPGTGIVLGAAPKQGAVISLSPLIIANHNVGDTYFVGAASGGASAPAVMAQIMARAIIEEVPLEKAVAAPRLYHGGLPDVVVHESSETSEVLEGLTRHGQSLMPTEQIARVNAIYCPKGARRQWGTCAFVSDQRGFGMATASQF